MLPTSEFFFGNCFQLWRLGQLHQGWMIHAGGTFLDFKVDFGSPSFLAVFFFWVGGGKGVPKMPSLFQGGRGRLHQEFQVPKMEGFNKKKRMFFGYFGGGEIPVSISRIHTAYIGVSYLHFRYLKCLVFFLGEGGQRLVCKPHEWDPLFPKKCGS